MSLSARLRDRLARVPAAAAEAATMAMEKGAQKIVEEMRLAAPIDSGDLRDSINWTWGDAPAGSFVIADIRSGKNKGDQYATLRITIYAGSKKAFYARFVEFGTKAGNPAQPFFYPVWKARKVEFRREISKAVKAAIKKELG